jgi:hypothetical protein
MTESGAPLDVQTEAIRIQHVLDDTLDRNAGRTEAERAEALALALRDEMDALPAAARAAVLAALDALHPEEIVRIVAPEGPSVRERELEDEVAALRAQLAARPEAPAVRPAADPLGRRLLQTLLGSGGDASAVLDDAGSEPRVVGVVEALVEFAETVGRSILGLTADPDRTMAGRIRGMLVSELEGRAPAGGLATQLKALQRDIGNQILAFREGSQKGAQDLLKRLAPDVLEAQYASKQRGVLLKVGYFKDLWELFSATHDELKRADDVYDEFFERPYLAALQRARRRAPERRGKG